MNVNDDRRHPQPEEEDAKWGMLVVLAFLLGVPLLGILYNLLFNRPSP